MKHLYILIIIGIFGFTNYPTFAQKSKSKSDKKGIRSLFKKKNKAKQSGGKELNQKDTIKTTNQFTSKYLPVKEPSSDLERVLVFSNINKVSYYLDEEKIADIKQFKKNKQWRAYYEALLEYVGKFGVHNFIKSMNIVWQLARTAEYLEEMQVAKEVYRIIIKHYRGDIQKALIQYNKLIKFEKDLYVDLSYYYQLVERLQLIDTIYPPNKKFVNLGEEINSPYEDYGMTIVGQNDSLLIFTSDRNIDTTKVHAGLSTKQQDENIYISEKDADGFRLPPKPFDAINSKYKEGSPTMNQSGDLIIFSRCNNPGGYGNCDLYMSHKLDSTYWSEAINLGRSVNSYAWDSHPSLSITEDTLYFVSNRKGGLGGSDIYFSVKNKTTKRWGNAQNIGPIINTKANEYSPYQHPLFNTLYFSSSGQIFNFGQIDIYKTKRNNDQWAEPKNVGPLINGKGREKYFTINMASEYLFYAKSKEKQTDLDLHSFLLPMEAKPKTVKFSGKVLEKTTGETFEGIVAMIDLDEHVEIAPKYLRENGSFEFELENHKNYLLVIDGDNFFRIEEMFYLDGNKNTTIPVVSLNAALTFEALDFEKNSSKLKPEMENNLHTIINFLLIHPDFILTITGHTDLDGDVKLNRRLSKERADVIKKYLVSYGDLDKSRIISLGAGSSDPIIKKEKTEVHKKLNRRVEFKISKVENN